MHPTAISLPVVLPEAILALGTLALVLYGALRGERAYNLVTEVSVALLGIVFVVLVAKHRPMGITFYGAFADDAFTRFMSGLALVGSLVTLLLSLEFMRAERIAGFEFPVLILLSTLGMLMLISANDFIALYLGLELMSLALYVIAAYRRHDLRATEAGLKYFVLGALSSGMLLYGASLIYGYSGSVSFAADADEGAPTPVTTLFASAPKIAAMAILVRVMVTAFPGIASDWRQIITFVSIASMGLGAFAAIGQSNFKRLMAYSSIGHMGYALVGLAAGTVEGVQSVIIYMAIYVVMTLGTFAAILSMRRGGRAIETTADLAGLARTDSTMAFFLATMMFSLAGIPPLAGFFAKFYVFAAAIKAGLYGLSVIGVLASAVAAYYYLRIVKLMYFDEPAKAFDRPDPVARIVLAVSALLIILFVFLPSPITNAAMAAAQSLF